MKVLIDYSVIMHLSWNQMFSDSYEAIKETEKEEYILNLTRNLFYIKTLFKGDTTLCLDAPTNWRQQVVKDYYEPRLNLHKDISPDCKYLTYYYFVDGDIWKFEYVDSIGSWKRGKLRKKEERDNIQFLDLEEIDNSVIKTLEVWSDAMKHVVPYYKGQRSHSNWKGYMTKAEWKEYSRDIAPKIAAVMGFDCIVIDHCEGDDIITGGVMHYNKSNPDDEIVVVSVDQDLYQLKTLHSHVTYYNPRNHEIVKISPDEARYKLIAKIVGGDGSDNINGIMIDGKRQVEVSWISNGVVKGGKSTLNLIDKHLDVSQEGTDITKSAYDFFRSVAEDDSFEKNLILVYLKNIPKELLKQMDQRFLDWEVVDNNIGYTYDNDLYFSQKMRISTANDANNDRTEIFQ